MRISCVGRTDSIMPPDPLPLTPLNDEVVSLTGMAVGRPKLGLLVTGSRSPLCVCVCVCVCMCMCVCACVCVCVCACEG